jgi:hypothetical protein
MKLSFILLLGAAAVSLSSAQAQFKIAPFLTCVTHDTTAGTVTAYFGYESFEQSIINIPVGSNNRIIPDPADRNQPTLFFPGYFEKAFRFTFPDASNIFLSFNGFAIPASATSLPCPSSMPNLPPGLVGLPYTQQLAAIGGQAGLTWSAVSGFPSGLGVSSGGQINGTPLAAGQFTVTVQVTDGLTASNQTYELTINSSLAINDPASTRAPGFSPQFRVAMMPSSTISATVSCDLNEFAITGGGACTVPNSNTVTGRIATSQPSANGWTVICSGGTATAVAVCSLK